MSTLNTSSQTAKTKDAENNEIATENHININNANVDANKNINTNSDSTKTDKPKTTETSSLPTTQQNTLNNENKNITNITEQESKNTANENDSKNENDETKESKTNLIINYIPPTMNEIQLQTLFSPYGTMKNCRIVYDLNTGRSKGYGFVEYKNEESSLRALQALNGFMAQGKKLKVGFARPNSKEIQNGNLYITNLPFDFTDENLRKLFQEFGQIVECRILHDNEGKSRGVGFVRMDTHLNAVNALQARDNHIIRSDLPPITVQLAQRRMPKRILQLQWQQQNSRNKNFNFKGKQGNTGNNGGRQQQPNRRYVRQQPNNNNYYNNRGNYRSRNNMNNEMYNQNNRQYYYDPNLRNAPMYGNVNDFPQYPMFPPQYYETNELFNAPMNVNVASDINNQQIANNRQQPKSNPVNVNDKNNNTPTFNITVNNLPDYYNVDHLIQMFAPYGPIQFVNIQKSPSTKQSTGFVSYYYFDDAKKAQSQANGKRIKETNQRLEVIFQSS